MESDDEEFIAAALVSLGLNKKAAKAMTYLQAFNSATVLEFNRKTGLRQPDVSQVMKELVSRGWVKESEIKKPGKGRAYKIYSCDIDFSEMLDQLEKEQEERKLDMAQLMLRDLKDFKK
jgi:predicted transcriptional regulator